MEISEKTVFRYGKNLRKGYTTGSCAAAASAAAVEMILGGDLTEQVSLTTPIGVVLDLDIEKIEIENDCVSCAVRKFSGDDPDITNGIYVHAKVKKISSGIHVLGGLGVGTVSEPGLSVEVGKSAINPVPMKMIVGEVRKIAEKYAYKKGFEIEISIPDGVRLAQKTYNPRLGIVGGISVLGTTGIVEPMSNKALVDTIKVEIDMLKAKGEDTVLVVPGNYGRDFARQQFGIEFEKAVQCSNFIGEALDYIAHIGFKNVIVMGHAGKLVKVAGGIMNTHSSVADCRMEILAAHTALVHTVDSEMIQVIMNSITIDSANRLLKRIGINEKVWQSVGDKMIYHMGQRLGDDTGIFAVIFGEDGILYQYGDSKIIKGVHGG